MKIYFHLNLEGFSNCYLLVNETNKEAIIVDPGEVTEELIEQIESVPYHVAGVLITHNHGSHVNGLKTLRKIYSPKILAADWDVAREDTTVISGDGKIRIGGMLVHYMAVPGHTADSMVYKIGNMLFTGDVLMAGTIGNTVSSYSKYILKSNIEQKILSQTEDTVIFPGHGPLATVESIKAFNIDFESQNPGNMI
ncbi:MAG: MBL fold metallo-hydrolase [Treponema sp.]|nr:MBL fold metallo-hydrolase [Treponema sp.]